MDWLAKVENIAQEVAKKEGCYLYDLEFIGVGKGRTLRVYIDKDDNGIGIDDCSNVSKRLNDKLDTEDIVPGGTYQLEVSSPGLDRTLKKTWHFEKAIGKKIWVKLNSSLESVGVEDKKWKNAKQIEKVLSGCDQEGLEFELDSLKVKVPFGKIEKAKMVFDMEKGKKK